MFAELIARLSRG